MRVLVLTAPDCSNCTVLEKMLDALDMPYDLVDVVENPSYLEKYPIFTAPGLVIDKKLVFTGIPKIDDLERMLLK
ncbi:thioredoxin family protein [archaeon]|nr:thioredoxin family protein [archaeon]